MSNQTQLPKRIFTKTRQDKVAGLPASSHSVEHNIPPHNLTEPTKCVILNNVEDECTFGEFTIPSKLRIGWYFGTDRFEPEGEFFRCMIDEVIYR